MKKSTFRIIKSIGIFLFLIVFGVFIFLLIKSESVREGEIVSSTDSYAQDSDTGVETSSDNKPIGFEYQRVV